MTSPWDRQGSPDSTGANLIAGASAIYEEPSRLFRCPQGSTEPEILGGGRLAPAERSLPLLCQLRAGSKSAGCVFQLELKSRFHL